MRFWEPKLMVLDSWWDTLAWAVLRHRKFVRRKIWENRREHVWSDFGLVKNATKTSLEGVCFDVRSASSSGSFCAMDMVKNLALQSSLVCLRLDYIKTSAKLESELSAKEICRNMVWDGSFKATCWDSKVIWLSWNLVTIFIMLLSWISTVGLWFQRLVCVLFEALQPGLGTVLELQNFSVRSVSEELDKWSIALILVLLFDGITRLLIISSPFVWACKDRHVKKKEIHHNEFCLRVLTKGGESLSKTFSRLCSWSL